MISKGCFRYWGYNRPTLEGFLPFSWFVATSQKEWKSWKLNSRASLSTTTYYLLPTTYYTYYFLLLFHYFSFFYVCFEVYLVQQNGSGEIFALKRVTWGEPSRAKLLEAFGFCFRWKSCRKPIESRTWMVFSGVFLDEFVGRGSCMAIILKSTQLALALPPKTHQQNAFLAVPTLQPLQRQAIDRSKSLEPERAPMAAVKVTVEEPTESVPNEYQSCVETGKEVKEGVIKEGCFVGVLWVFIRNLGSKTQSCSR